MRTLRADNNVLSPAPAKFGRAGVIPLRETSVRYQPMPPIRAASAIQGLGHLSAMCQVISLTLTQYRIHLLYVKENEL